MELEKEVKTFKITMLCDNCELGFMEPTGLSFTTNPPIYEHKCSYCGNIDSYTTVYPNIRYR